MFIVATPVALADVTYQVDTVEDRIDDDVTDGICRTSVNTCALRAALMQANRLSGPGVTRITLPAGTYILTRPATPGGSESNGDLNLAAPLAGDQRIDIVGGGMATTIIHADQIDRVLAVAAGRSATISDLTLRNGFRQPNAGDGGGILKPGNASRDAMRDRKQPRRPVRRRHLEFLSLVVSDTRIANNFAYIGGGVAVGGIGRRCADHHRAQQHRRQLRGNRREESSRNHARQFATARSVATARPEMAAACSL